jgi:hypothetical protein
MTVRDYIDGSGKTLVKILQFGRGRIFYGRPGYNRWFGLFRLDNRLGHKMKMIRRNGYRS